MSSKHLPGSVTAIYWAWTLDLPPRQKLAMLYLADGHRIHTHVDHGKFARFIGVAVHETPRILLRLAERGLIDTNEAGEVVVVYK